MNFARSDTYINVYLPRVDGEDPRDFARPNSPLFESDHVYKFSDEIVKDRKLFLGRKQLSLYEIYYKDNPNGANDIKDKRHVNESVEIEEIEDENDSQQDGRDRCGDTHIELPSIKRVSLSLESQILRAKRDSNLKRFNEPLNSYVTNRKRVQNINKFEPTDGTERQTTAFEFLNAPRREGTYAEFLTRTKTMQRLLSKAVSAPTDTRSLRSLPPILLGHTNRRPQTTLLHVTQASAKEPAVPRRLPVRPDSKHHKVWRQTNNLVMEKFTPKLITRVRHPTHQSRLHVGSKYSN